MVGRRDFLKLGAAAALFGGAAWAAEGADAQFYALLDRLAALPEPAAGAPATLAALRGFDPAPLSFEARLDYDGIIEGLGLEAEFDDRFAFGLRGAAPSPYAVSQRSGAYLTLDTATAEVVAAETARVKTDAARGIVPPDFILDAAIDKLGKTLAAAPAPLKESLGAQMCALADLHPRATQEAGVWRLPDGDAYYALALKIGTSLPLDPQAAHDEGLRQVGELSARAEPLLRKLGLRKRTVGARLHALGQQARFLYSDDDAGRARAVAQMNARLALARSRLATAFAEPVRGAVTVERAGPGKIGYRTAPSYDGTKPGAYYVDLRDIRRRPSWSLPTVVHHETLPGHLLQLALQEHANPHPLRLRTTPNAFFEGWAIYAEQLAGEMGLFADDDLARLGMLQSLLVRAARLTIDTGIHFKRWSREQAIARFFAIAGDAPDTLENEVDRIVVQPGYTAGPALGRMTILKLRAAARAKPGFDLKAFHTALLKRGQMRLTMMERAVVADLRPR